MSTHLRLVTDVQREEWNQTNQAIKAAEETLAGRDERFFWVTPEGDAIGWLQVRPNKRRLCSIHPTDRQPTPISELPGAKRKRIKAHLQEFLAAFHAEHGDRVEPACYPPVNNNGGHTKMEVEKIASVAHETNRAYCAATGDNSQVAWDAAPAWQRDSAVDGVKFLQGNPEAGPSSSHENWLKEKEAAGWKHGPVKDPEKKEHPCFCTYDDLPEAQKVKDLLFVSVVRALS